MNAQKVGIMISAAPADRSFQLGLAEASEALAQGASVYLYFIDDAVAGIAQARVPELKRRGVKVFACAFSLEERGLKNEADCTLAGLSVLSDVIASTDRFASYN